MLLMHIAELARKLFSPPDEPESTRLGRALIEEISKPKKECDVRKCLSLIERGADLGLENDDNETAFLLAAFQGQTELFKAIAQKGVDPDQTDALKNTALIIAVEANNAGIVDFLVDEFVSAEGRRADAEKKNYFGDTAYSIARRMGFSDIAAKISKRMSAEAITAAEKRAKAPASPSIF